jgi:hypothetical protein
MGPQRCQCLFDVINRRRANQRQIWFKMLQSFAVVRKEFALHFLAAAF